MNPGSHFPSKNIRSNHYVKKVGEKKVVLPIRALPHAPLKKEARKMNSIQFLLRLLFLPILAVSLPTTEASAQSPETLEQFVKGPHCRLSRRHLLVSKSPIRRKEPRLSFGAATAFCCAATVSYWCPTLCSRCLRNIREKLPHRKSSLHCILAQKRSGTKSPPPSRVVRPPACAIPSSNSATFMFRRYERCCPSH